MCSGGPGAFFAPQVWAGVVRVGPSGKVLNSSYQYRDKPEYRSELGNAIVNFARIVPDGMLVFFPSYYLLNACMDAWRQPASDSAQAASIWRVLQPRPSRPVPTADPSYAVSVCPGRSGSPAHPQRFLPLSGRPAADLRRLLRR